MSGFDELTECTHLLGDYGAREQFWEENGYLFFRDALDLDLVEGVRQQLVTAFKAQGAVLPDASVEDFTLQSRDDIVEDPLHDAVDYDALWHAPGTVALFERVLGVPVYVFRSTSFRFMVPNEEQYLASAHQDSGYIGPNEDFRTAWVPLMDLPSELGGLAIAAGSHRRGARSHVVDDAHISYTSAKKPILHVPLDEIAEPWLTTEFALGDLLIFHAHMVHRSLPNQSMDGRIRLSIDTRFQPAEAPRGFVASNRTPDLKTNVERGVFARLAGHGSERD